MSKPTVYIIAGPTASGKTSHAIQLAQQLHTQIISADSRQCYSELNIGVARPSIDELSTIPHHFIASHSIRQPLSAGGFVQYAQPILQHLLAQYNSAVIVGGTGMYINALIYGLDNIPAIPQQLKDEIDTQYKQYGLQWLQQQLHLTDPLYTTQGNMLNPARMQRALAVILHTGNSIISYQVGAAQLNNYDVTIKWLNPPREQLYHQINTRVHTMLQQGLLDEVKALLPHQHLPVLNTVGYVELFDYINNKCTLPQAIEKIQQHTRNYAKRQITWCRKYYGEN
jgi:tRNA dimethylallyltransferase